MSGRRTKKQWSGYAFLAPYLLLFATFLLFPLGYGLWLSTTAYDLASTAPPRFVGLGNYREALADPDFRSALLATVLFVVMAVPMTVGAALGLAVLLDQLPQRRQNVYRVVLFLPTMITISVAGLIWRWFYNSEFGLFNALLAPLGVKVPWLSDPNVAMPAVVLMTVWWTAGAPTVILAAGLKQIPKAYYEAAAIDGAVGLRRFAWITLPLLRPVLLFVLVIQLIGAFQVFGQTFIITRGGPERSTRVLVQYIYETAFNAYRLGYGAAMSWLLFAVIAVVAVVQFRLARER